MLSLPHRYRVQAHGTDTGPVRVSAAGVTPLDTHAPPEFGGPGGYWSPEALLAAAVADCYILSFRAVARASGLAWDDLKVEVEGVLDRAEGITCFTEFRILPTLALPSRDAVALADKVLDKAKRACLVTNSLSARCVLQAELRLPA